MMLDVYLNHLVITGLIEYCPVGQEESLVDHSCILSRVHQNQNKHTHSPTAHPYTIYYIYFNAQMSEINS